MSLRDQLQAIYDRHQDLTPALVVEEARPKSHPMHDRFEWDNKVAGEAWRRVQAQELIRSVRVVYRAADDKEDERSVRAWQAVRNETGHTYKPSEEVAEDSFMREIVLRDMEREWLQLRRRYERFSEFVAMVRRDVAEDAA